MRRWRRWLSAIAACAVITAAFAPTAAAQGPGSPPGVNDGCNADVPVVLVHGTFATQQEFFKLAQRLKSEGYCLYALNYGCMGSNFSCGRGRIEASARELRDFINKEVLPHSRSGKVSIIGHSQGGLMPRYYIKFLGGHSKVVDMISFSASNHGTDNPLAPFSFECPACRQQHPYMSAFTRKVNEGDETPGRVAYTQVQTRYDDVVFPYFSSYLADDPDNDYNGPRTLRLNGPRTTNYCVQDQYPFDVSDHLTIVGDDLAYVPVLDALERAGPARPPDRPDSVCARLGADPGGGGAGSPSPGPRPRCTITGSSRNDVLVGTSGDDVICAGPGADIVRGRGGDDRIYGGGGNDVLRGGAGDDSVRGGGGNDVVRGGAGSDDLFGGDGRDAINSRDGMRGNDSIDGGAGRDACNGDFGDGRANCP